MSKPRGVEAKISWFLSHKPDLNNDGTPDVGACANHSWKALGGDRGNPPAWGAANANAVYDKVVKAGRYFTTEPPRGALVLWKYGSNGHAAIAWGSGKIATTDADAASGRHLWTGVESIDYPKKWGAKSYIWTDTYNGVKFPVEVRPTVRLSKVLRAAKTDPKAADGAYTAKADVKVLESALVAEGLLDKKYADGHFGTLTIQAYSKWQKRLGYKGKDADGLPGSASLKALAAKHGFIVA